MPDFNLKMECAKDQKFSYKNHGSSGIKNNLSKSNATKHQKFWQKKINLENEQSEDIYFDQQWRLNLS